MQSLAAKKLDTQNEGAGAKCKGVSEMRPPQRTPQDRLNDDAQMCAPFKGSTQIDTPFKSPPFRVFDAGTQSGGLGQTTETTVRKFAPAVLPMAASRASSTQRGIFPLCRVCRQFWFCAGDEGNQRVVGAGHPKRGCAGAGAGFNFEGWRWGVMRPVRARVGNFPKP